MVAKPDKKKQVEKSLKYIFIYIWIYGFEK